MSASALVEVTPVVVARSVNYDIREINRLEALIVADEDTLLWQQAEHVVALLNAGMSQRALARQWRNVRTGKPYSKTHVLLTAQVYGQLTDHPRPRFRDAYNKLANPIHDPDEECYTLSPYIEAARMVMGAIDMDPASHPDANKVVRAPLFFTKEDDALIQHWSGRLWLNPPYTRGLIDRFVAKLVAHVQAGDVTAAIVLVNSATDTRWWATLHRHAATVCFPTGRVLFLKTDGRHEPSWILGTSIFYFGPDPQKFQQVFGQFVWRGEVVAK